MPAQRRYMTLLACAGMLLMQSGVPARAEPAANALPNGFSVSSGNVDIPVISGSDMSITQSSNRAVIDWQSFDIGRDASVTFIQPGTQSLTVNRVSGGTDPTQIYGHLSANGGIVVLDRNGVIFGKTARVDAASLLAATGEWTNENEFAQGGAIQLSGTDAINNRAAIENAGTLSAADGGLIALVAPAVRNSGVIQARLGQVILASGAAATIDMHGDGLINFAVSGNLGKALGAARISNSGKIQADGGQVLMTVRTASGIADTAINNTGIVYARNFSVKNGSIILDDGKALARQLDDAVFAGTGTSLQSVIDDMAAAGDRNLYLADGTYTQSLTLHHALNLEAGQSTARMTGDGSAPVISVTGNDVRIRGLQISGGEAAGIYAAAVTGLEILQNVFTSAASAAIDISKSLARIAGNYFTHSGQNGPIELADNIGVTLSENLFFGQADYAARSSKNTRIEWEETNYVASSAYLSLLHLIQQTRIDDSRLRLTLAVPKAPEKEAEIIILTSGDASPQALARLAPAAGGDADGCTDTEAGCP